MWNLEKKPQSLMDTDWWLPEVEGGGEVGFEKQMEV